MRNILISIIVLGVASLSLISEDFLKFLLAGQSDTNSILLVRHSSITVFTLSLIVILFIFLFNKRHLYKYLLGISLVFWVFSLRTFVVMKSHDIFLISGFSIFPIKKCEVSPKDRCFVKFDFLMKREVEKAISSSFSDESPLH